jgi:hypothetical protein
MSVKPIVKDSWNGRLAKQKVRKTDWNIAVIYREHKAPVISILSNYDGRYCAKVFLGSFVFPGLLGSVLVNNGWICVLQENLGVVPPIAITSCPVYSEKP